MVDMEQFERNAIGAAYAAGREQIVRYLGADGDDSIFIHPNGPGSTVLTRVDTSALQPFPRRATGTYLMRDVESFIAYLLRHKSGATVVYARRDGHLTGVLNAHGAEHPGWADHQVALSREQTRGWAAWRVADGREFSQQAFAEFLEDRVGEITKPDGADLVELAEEFRAHTSVRFRSQKRLSNGQTQIEYVEQVEGGSEKNGQLVMPTEVDIAVRPYQDSEDVIRATLRLRWRMEGSAVKFRLVFPETVGEQLDEIHAATNTTVQTATGVPLFLVAAGA